VDSFPEAKPENDEAGSLFEKAIDGFGPLDIAMVNAGLEVIDVPFTTHEESDRSSGPSTLRPADQLLN
jgi:hypothetical protein